MTARGGHALVGADARRRRLRLAGIVAAVVALLVTGAATMANAQEHDHDLLPEGDWSEEQMAAAMDLVMRTEEELAAYSDPDQLEAQGFVNFGATAPGGYDHWTNPDFLTDDHILDPAFPESLVYQFTDDGGYVLVAAMFEMNIGDTMEDVPDEIAWYPGWHSHPDLCADENFQFTGFVDENGECAVGEPILVPMMHVWIVDNECGHRFGGVDQSGLMCDVEGHPGGGHGGSTTSTTHQHGTTSTTAAPTTTTTAPSTTSPGSAPPAWPVPAEPNLTG
jgi:hypothetical protein